MTPRGMYEKPKYHEEVYRNIHIAWTRQLGVWHIYYEKRLMTGVGFDTAKSARKWLRNRVDRKLAPKE